MSDAEPVLPLPCGRALGLAVLAAVKLLGAETVQIDEDDDVTLIRLARIGARLVIVERAGDRTTSRPHRFTGYEIDETEPGAPFRLDPDRALFVLHEQHFATPPDWHLQLVRDPRRWFNEVMASIHEALGETHAD